MAAQNYIELVAKSVRVLEVLAETGAPVGLQTLTTRVGLVKSSVFRILFTLRELGYVEQRGRGSYCLTPKLHGLARSRRTGFNLIDLVHPHLERLRSATNESAWLADWRRKRAVLIDVAEASNQRLRLSLAIGDICPLHASALGKSIAAHLPPEELARLLGVRGLPRFTTHTIVDRDQLMNELALVRERGYAVNDQETVEGAFLAGAPLFDSRGRVFAAISVSAPTARCTPEKRRTMVEAAKHAGIAITRELNAVGYRSATG
jgi:IclR family acetate operon transcriptional repressor